jgi:predicted DsbA family dithiol-disulfide isomerase
MTRVPIKITFFFDFLCAYSYRTAQWIDTLQQQLGDGLQVEWKYFSLEQNKAKELESDWNIWEQQEDYTCPLPKGRPWNRAMLAFWGAEAARRQSEAGFTRFRQALYAARHNEKADISQRATIEDAAEQAELDMEQFQRDFSDRSLLDALHRDHQEAVEKYKVFGVPTVAFDQENLVYLKLQELPPPEDALTFFHDLRSCFTRRPWLAEVKRPG